ncbi:hypothetical protein EIP91_007030 [Steccherinum ochraceum]|uniref:Uncharacterized protein n=1 Tax=Steccherinum ochraceum TaxID=92696 RepID=A0A4V2MXC5_9APHY|nr:hypothetical protein EIP91_007030 [Steccherinum ochraceum]
MASYADDSSIPWDLLSTSYADQLIFEQLRTSLWYRIYEMTGVWWGFYNEQDVEAWLSLKVSQLHMVLAPWSVLAFPSRLHFFVVMAHVLEDRFTRALVMNQLRENSLQDLLNFTIYSPSSILSLLPSAHTSLISSSVVDAQRSITPVYERSVSFAQLPVFSEDHDIRSPGLFSPAEDHVFRPCPSTASLELLSWNDACFEDDEQRGHAITLCLEHCGVYTSPGGFNSGTASLPGDDALELAMVIAEQIALLSGAFGPIPTDMPLLFSPLDQGSLSDLHSWLQTSYDWPADLTRLLASNVSAEDLAWEVMGHRRQITSLSDDSHPIGHLQSPGHPASAHALTMEALPEAHIHPVPKTRSQLTRKTDLSIIVYPKDELSSIEVTTSPEVPIRARRSRLIPKAPLSIVVHPKADIPPVELVNSPEISPVRVPTLALPTTPSKYLKGEVELDIGMASYSSWNGGRKASILAGLLAVGSLLSPSPRSPFFPRSAGLDVRSPPQARRSILSPWLDVVHIHGLEEPQSPWIADHSEANTAALFPESPFSF